MSRDSRIKVAVETVVAIEAKVVDNFNQEYPDASQAMRNSVIPERIRLAIQVYCALVMEPYPVPEVI